MNKLKIRKLIKEKSIPDKYECWIWQGALKGKSKLKSYGSLTVGSRSDNTRKTISAHRASYTAFVGEIPQDTFVCHKCDTPQCVNPSHLFLGSRQDNVNDREIKKRNKIPKLCGEKHPKSKLDWSKVEAIRSEPKVRGYISKLAKRFGVSYRTISDVASYTTWAKPKPPEVKRWKI